MGPNDFDLFGPLKKWLTGKWFPTHANMKQAAIQMLQELDTNLPPMSNALE
jgi:hypothetical protein